MRFVILPKIGSRRKKRLTALFQDVTIIKN